MKGLKERVERHNYTLSVDKEKESARTQERGDELLTRGQLFHTHFVVYATGKTLIHILQRAQETKGSGCLSYKASPVVLPLIKFGVAAKVNTLLPL